MSLNHVSILRMQSGDFVFQDVQFGDLDLYSEDAWMSVSVSFNPYQCDLSPLIVSYLTCKLLMGFTRCQVAVLNNM